VRREKRKKAHKFSSFYLHFHFLQSTRSSQSHHLILQSLHPMAEKKNKYVNVGLILTQQVNKLKSV
jgi:hypothetical protein